MKPASVLIYADGGDTGGQGYRIKRAFDRYQPTFSVRSVHTLESYFAYPTDLYHRNKQVRQLVEEADVVHLRNGVHYLHHLPVKPNVRVVAHYHGTRFREEHATLAIEAQAVGALQIASTLDLTLLEPGVVWIPSPYEVDDLAQIRLKTLRKDGPVRIAHAPTNRQVKSTFALMAAITQLNAAGYSCVLDLIERRPWAEVLERKARADIYVDQVRLGYGNNAIEAWSMGVPVVAGVEDPLVRAEMLDRWGELPFYEATEDTLASVLATLIDSQKLRDEWGERGWEFVLRWHGAERVSNRLAEVYEAALANESEGRHADLV